MKILKYMLFVILGLIIIFFLFGLFNPYVAYESKIVVEKPVKETWAVAKDESKFDQWLLGFKSIELISGKQEEEGSKYRVVVDPGQGQDEFEMIETLVSYKEFEEVVFHFDSDFMDFDQKIIHTEQDGSTTIRTESKVYGKGIISRSMFAIMEIFGGAFTAQEQKNMDALKKVIEENTTDYYPLPVVEEIIEMPEETNN